MRSNAKRNETSEVDASAAQVQVEDASANRAPSGEEIWLRAYEIYLERNGLPGDELDDWLRAERELQNAALFTGDWNRLHNQDSPAPSAGTGVPNTEDRTRPGQ